MSTLGSGDEGKRNLVELIEFVSMFSGSLPQAELQMTYPELFNEEIDAQLAIEMYRRFARETLDVFDRYPPVRNMVV